MLSCFSYVRLLVTLCTIAFQAPLVHGILQVRVLEWDAMPSFRGSSKPWIKPASLMAPALSSSFFIISATWEAHNTCDFTFNILFYNVIMHLGCGGPSLLNGRFLPLPGVRVPLESWCSGFSLCCLVLLWSMGSRVHEPQQSWRMGSAVAAPGL